MQLRGASLPASLMDLPDPVDALYLWGRLPPVPRIAVVGTRRPTESARAFTREFVATLCQQGVSVISGGAEGIDTTVHEECLATSSPTLVVGPSGFSQPYPRKNRALFQEVLARGGGYVSAQNDDAVVRRHHFFLRNSLLVALSEATVVVEAPLRSGARNAAGWARKLARALFVVPHAPWNATGSGNLVELQLGARMLTRPSQVIEWLESKNAHPLGDRRDEGHTLALPGLGTADVRMSAAQSASGAVEPLLALLQAHAQTLEQLLSHSQLSRSGLIERLTELELDGVVVRDPSGLLYQLAK